MYNKIIMEPATTTSEAQRKYIEDMYSEYQKKDDFLYFFAFGGLPRWVRDRLREEGCPSLVEARSASDARLLEIKGIGPAAIKYIRGTHPSIEAKRRLLGCYMTL